MNRREKGPKVKQRRKRWPRARWAATRLKIPGPKYTSEKPGSRKQTCSINNGAHSCAPWSPSLQRDCFDWNGNPKTRKGLTSPPLKIRRINRRAKAGYSLKESLSLKLGPARATPRLSALPHRCGLSRTPQEVDYHQSDPDRDPRVREVERGPMILPVIKE